MINFPDIPSDQSCKTVNPTLFRFFQKTYFKHTKEIATPLWTEAEVVQWLDFELDNAKYLYDALDKNIR
jgi:hypothetical protein